MESVIELSKTAQDALNRIMALRGVTRETGTVTKNTQSLILRQLGPQDLSDVSLALAIAGGDALSGRTVAR